MGAGADSMQRWQSKSMRPPHDKFVPNVANGSLVKQKVTVPSETLKVRTRRDYNATKVVELGVYRGITVVQSE